MAPATQPLACWQPIMPATLLRELMRPGAAMHPRELMDLCKPMQPDLITRTECVMERQRAIRAIVIPVMAFAAVILVAFGFGMFLHIVPHGTTPLFALAATLGVTIAGFVASSRASTANHP
jgi:hypothetical protein